MADLWVVMPVYNEEDSVEAVVREWLKTFRSVNPDFVFCVLNDGSIDRSLSILQQLSKENPEIRIVDKTNSGHGQSCIEGYRLAIREGAPWVFQIDSDGQCDTRFFKTFWDLRQDHPVIFGCRKWRDDGIKRQWVSKILCGVVFFASGVWVRDPNVPYRLMNAKPLQQILPSVPPDFDLANVVVSILLTRLLPIFWVDIRFLKRRGGEATKSAGFFATKALRLWKELRSI